LRRRTTIALLESPNLGDGYIEAILLDADGEPIGPARVLFP
jgi:hypothetical protein